MKKVLQRVVPAVLVLSAAAAAWRFWPRQPFVHAGTIEADEADLSAAVSSRIEAYEVREGDRVRRGQVLVRLACEDIRLAESQAEDELRRATALNRAGSLPRAQLDRARFQRDDLAVRRSWCTIKAPSDGTVLSTYHLAGEWARPGMNLLTLADLTRLHAVVYVPQPLLAALRLGGRVSGRLPELPGRVFPGTIATIRQEAEFTPKNVQTRDERERLVYGVKVRFDNPEGILKPGMTIEVDLPGAPAR